ncbi:competence type IV pilus minor pilin ComGF [Listeria cornellensis]|uniref:ComG operon protein 6 (ComGF) n=1 Tax=Listeria cornellensis FSL F6-0969 TaxID=1265820 RepID=W7C0X8_9LIST|nr:competence type IV pilus minor pilin ComGF [Listeria cornellensis]EUJ30840.1 comG operon protein 6 (ComGF) [Listeria cornellensis FSL F6-0969]
MLKKIFVTLSNKYGFTLLESLFSLLIVIIIASFIPLIFQSYTSVMKIIDIDKNYEWHLFLNQTRKELTTGNQITVTDHKITFYAQSKLITYESYQNLTRRSVDNKGHEPLLTNIKQDKWTKKSEGEILYEVIFEDDTQLSARFYVQSE